MTDKVKCPNCGSEKIYHNTNIGFDIYVTKDEDVCEEHQHIEECLDCGQWRFVFDYIYCSGKEPKIGVPSKKWYPKEEAII